jgi:hypothetical protein
VGQFRICTKFFPLATQPTGSWLVALLPKNVYRDRGLVN